MLTIEELLKNGKEFNHQWIEKTHISHYLVQMAAYWASPNIHNKFIETCCEITAEMISDKLGVKKWQLAEGSFEEVSRLSPFFRISIGTSFDDIDHILTIWNNFIIHSFFGHYSIQATPLTVELIEAFNSFNYTLIAGFAIENEDLKVFYWTPA